MANRASIGTDGVITMTFAGDQNAKTYAEIIKRTHECVEQLQQADRPVRMLIDISKLGKLSTETRKAAVTSMKRVSYEKIALYGANAVTKALIGLIIHAAGKTSKVRLFNSKAEARDWLAVPAHKLTHASV